MAHQTVAVGAGSGGVAQVTIDILVRILSDLIGQSNITPPTIQNSFSVIDQQYVTFTAGSSAVTVPTGAVGMIIIPPVANTQTITLKGIVGDTGIPLNKIAPSLITGPDAGLSDFVLTVGGTITGVYFIFF